MELGRCFMSKIYYVKMARGWLDHPMFEGQEFSDRTAWCWMVEAALWKDSRVNILGQPVMLKRGQFSHSIRFMAERFGWSKARVEALIKRFKKWDMITTDNRTGQLVVTICNYNKYQDVPDSKQDSNRTANETATGQQQDKEEELKKIRSKKIVTVQPPAAVPVLDKKHPDYVSYNNTIIRLSNKDFDAWKAEFGLGEDAMLKYLDNRNHWLSKMPLHIQKRWWHSTRKDLASLDNSLEGADDYDYSNNGGEE